MREKFVRPLGGRQSREGRVRARFRRMRVDSDVEFVLPVIELHVNCLGNTTLIKMCHQLYVALDHHS